jgi:hypothetical protein
MLKLVVHKLSFRFISLVLLRSSQNTVRLIMKLTVSSEMGTGLFSLIPTNSHYDTPTTEGSNNATYKTKSDTYSLAVVKTVPRTRTIFPGRKPPSMIPT